MSIRVALAFVVLSGCYSPPDQVLGVWDRFIADGAYLPAGVIDRLTVRIEGDVTKERYGARVVGRWSDDGFHNVTLSFPGGDVTTWGILRVGCIEVPNVTCLRCDGRGPLVGQTDWYRPDYPIDAGAAY